MIDILCSNAGCWLDCWKMRPDKNGIILMPYSVGGLQLDIKCVLHT